MIKMLKFDRETLKFHWDDVLELVWKWLTESREETVAIAITAVHIFFTVAEASAQYANTKLNVYVIALLL